MLKKPYKALWFQVMTAMVLGLVVGLILSPLSLGVLTEVAAVGEYPRSDAITPGYFFLGGAVG